MPTLSELFPSKYVASVDLKNQNVPVTICNITIEEVDASTKERRPVLWFVGMKKGLVLNKTNGKLIAKYYGEELTHWINRAIVLYPTETAMKGEMVPCIRVRVDLQQVLPPITTPPVVQPQPEMPLQTAAVNTAAPAPVTTPSF